MVQSILAAKYSLSSLMKSNLHACPASVLNSSVQLDLSWSLHILAFIETLQKFHDQVASFHKGKLFCQACQRQLRIYAKRENNLRPRHFLAPPPKGTHSHPILLPSHL
jgi:hypothetical protein